MIAAGLTAHIKFQISSTVICCLFYRAGSFAKETYHFSSGTDGTHQISNQLYSYF